MQKADIKIDPNFKENVIKSSLSKIKNNNCGIQNLVIVMEELAELSQQISKYIRGESDMIGLTEELSDVILGIDYVKIICKIPDELINKAINVKLDRQNERNSE